MSKFPVNCPDCGQLVDDFFDHVDRDEFCNPHVARFEMVFRIRAYLNEIGMLAKIEQESGPVNKWTNRRIDAVFEEIQPFEPRDNFTIRPQLDTPISGVL